MRTETELQVRSARLSGWYYDVADMKGIKDTGGATQSNELSAVCEKVFFLGLAWHFAQRFFPDGAEQVCLRSHLTLYNLSFSFFNRCILPQYAKKAYELLWVFFGDPATAYVTFGFKPGAVY